MSIINFLTSAFLRGLRLSTSWVTIENPSNPSELRGRDDHRGDSGENPSSPSVLRGRHNHRGDSRVEETLDSRTVLRLIKLKFRTERNIKLRYRTERNIKLKYRTEKDIKLIYRTERNIKLKFRTEGHIKLKYKNSSWNATEEYRHKKMLQIIPKLQQFDLDDLLNKLKQFLTAFLLRGTFLSWGFWGLV